MVEETGRKKQGLLGQAWLILLLALLFGSSLAGVEIALKPRIERNKRNETFGQIPVLVQGGSARKSREERVGGIRVIRVLSKEGKHLGWVLPASGQGFADRIELLLGLDRKAAKITGLYVLDQKETPGLGSYIQDRDRFLGGFEGQPADKPLRVVKGSPAPRSGEIRAITGATISSMSVCGIVNRAVKEFRKALAERRGKD